VNSSFVNVYWAVNSSFMKFAPRLGRWKNSASVKKRNAVPKIPKIHDYDPHGYGPCTNTNIHTHITDNKEQGTRQLGIVPGIQVSAMQTEGATHPTMTGCFSSNLPMRLRRDYEAAGLWKDKIVS